MQEPSSSVRACRADIDEEGTGYDETFATAFFGEPAFYTAAAEGSPPSQSGRLVLERLDPRGLPRWRSQIGSIMAYYLPAAVAALCARLSASRPRSLWTSLG